MRLATIYVARDVMTGKDVTAAESVARCVVLRFFAAHFVPLPLALRLYLPFHNTY